MELLPFEREAWRGGYRLADLASVFAQFGRYGGETGGTFRANLLNVLESEDGRVVGYGSLGRSDLDWTRHIGEIRVLVDPEYRTQGIGALLAQELFNVAQDIGLSKVTARMVREQAGARAMFERLGFQAEALLADWVMDRDGKTRDLVLMSYDITALTN